MGLRDTVRRLWHEGGRTFLSGMARGFDLAAAEAVLELRGECAGSRLVAVVPYEGQAEEYSQEDRARYDRVLKAADEVVVLEREYSKGVFFRRNDYLVDNADRVVAWCVRPKSGTGYTIKRARSQRKEVINLMFPSLF